MRRVALTALALALAWMPAMSNAAEPVLLHAAGSRLPSRIEVHEPVTGLANLLRRGPRGRGRRIGT